ncbi:MAG: thiamine-phosphate kinase [Hyphomicrobiaceae bacterium]
MSSDNDSHGEEAIIQHFLAPLAAGYPGAYGLKDDCAAITPTPGHDLIVKTDPVAEGVHFFADDAPEHIGWKALAVNVSDLAAKAAVPRAYLMALSFPMPPTRDWMQRFANGLSEAQAAFGMHLIGGDTDRRPGPITISITVFGEVPTGLMVRRGTARPGDLIYVTGALGSAAIGLAIRSDRSLGLLDAWGIADDRSQPWIAALDAYMRPQPRLGLRGALRAHAAAAMDLSDGLAKDLDRMCRASGCGAIVQVANVPMLPVVRTAVAAAPKHWQDVLASGDDYEVLAAVAPENAAAFEAAAQRDGVAVTAIGAFRAGSGVELLDAAGAPLTLVRSGWDHF